MGRKQLLIMLDDIYTEWNEQMMPGPKMGALAQVRTPQNDMLLAALGICYDASKTSLHVLHTLNQIGQASGGGVQLDYGEYHRTYKDIMLSAGQSNITAALNQDFKGRLNSLKRLLDTVYRTTSAQIRVRNETEVFNRVESDLGITMQSYDVNKIQEIRPAVLSPQPPQQQSSFPSRTKTDESRLKVASKGGYDDEYGYAKYRLPAPRPFTGIYADKGWADARHEDGGDSDIESEQPYYRRPPFTPRISLRSRTQQGPSQEEVDAQNMQDLLGHHLASVAAMSAASGSFTQGGGGAQASSPTTQAAPAPKGGAGAAKKKARAVQSKLVINITAAIISAILWSICMILWLLVWVVYMIVRTYTGVNAFILINGLNIFIGVNMALLGYNLNIEGEYSVPWFQEKIDEVHSTMHGVKTACVKRLFPARTGTN